MVHKKLKVLLIIEQCNPDGVSVPLVGYRFYEGISRQSDVTLVTHSRNKASLEQRHPNSDIVYLEESGLNKRYYKLAAWLSSIKGKVIWPLRLMLTYPIYAEFNHQVYERFGSRIEQGEFDVVHAMTPMMPRYPVKAVAACRQTPFVLGPVNGGIPFPAGFESVARREFTGLNFLRVLGRMVVPGYRRTYEEADCLLAGSQYTAGLIEQLFSLESDRVQLFHENGLTADFFKQLDAASAAQPSQLSTESPSGKVNLLFVGRLVPYKSADILLDAIAALPAEGRSHLTLSIVGDGSERQALEKQAKALALDHQVTFTGWVSHSETLEFYRQADIFCFPSLREFGGAVVLEAMANGLPCIVVNHGGIGEYVTDESGFRIEPVSRAFIVRSLCEHIETLVTDVALRAQMGECAIARAKEFAWDVKAQKIVDIYSTLTNNESMENSGQAATAANLPLSTAIRG